MAISGKNNKVYVISGEVPMTASTGKIVTDIDNTTFSQMCDMLEVTVFGDDYKRRSAGLKDTNVKISGLYNPTDQGQLTLVPGEYVYLGLYPQGTGVDGKQIPMIVENFEMSMDTKDNQKISCSLLGNGAPVTLPKRS